ncbi:hypothetical protein [Microbacterium halotolerans]|uniref:hypothetical protein n=1 Tax=Microbacterium halotolerans TaxID=246613 RepID=UPI000E6AD9B7|nr:hypothetical protein [Microbacterium halotolerans]
MAKALIWTLTGVIVVGAGIAGVAAWSLMSSPDAPAAGDEEAGAPVAGIVVEDEVPALYTGNELEWFLLGAKEFGSLTGQPGLVAGDVSSELWSVGESEGWTVQEEHCRAEFSGTDELVIGERSARFAEEGSESAVSGGIIRASQYATPELAVERTVERMDPAGSCSRTTFGYYDGSELQSESSRTLLAERKAEGVQVVVEREETVEVASQVSSEAMIGRMVAGNVYVEVWSSHDDLAAMDPEGLAEALLERAAHAHEQLTQHKR